MVKFQTKEGTGNLQQLKAVEIKTWLSCSRPYVGGVNTNICDCRQAMKQHEDDCPRTSIIKDQTAKGRSLGIKCVPLLDINRH